MTATPTDQAARDRFAQTLDRNFSVIAAAGSGKTRAVTDRIAQLASNLIGNAVQHSPQGSPVRVSIDGTAEGLVFEVQNGGAPISDAPASRRQSTS
jgi:signal transduction histidine kinase